jgi:hypothetical protein
MRGPIETPRWAPIRSCLFCLERLRLQKFDPSYHSFLAAKLKYQLN